MFTFDCIAWSDQAPGSSCGQRESAFSPTRKSRICPPSSTSGERSDTEVRRFPDWPAWEATRVLIGRKEKRRIVYLGVHHSFEELDELMRRFNVRLCVVDALPETHATRAFAQRHGGKIFMNFFVESQRGATRWDSRQHLVQENRTEALDASRKALRDGLVVLPRQSTIVEDFAAHCASDAKQLHEDEDTGAQSYRYVRTGPDHFSLAFTYDVIAWERDAGSGRMIVGMIPAQAGDDLWITAESFLGDGWP